MAAVALSGLRLVNQEQPINIYSCIGSLGVQLQACIFSARYDARRSQKSQSMVLEVGVAVGCMRRGNVIECQIVE